jgi:hypothetical protein
MFDEVRNAAQAVTDYYADRIPAIPVAVLEDLLFAVANTNVLFANLVEEALARGNSDACA